MFVAKVDSVVAFLVAKVPPVAKVALGAADAFFIVAVAAATVALVAAF